MANGTPTLPTFPTVTDVLLSLQSATQALNSLLTNFNAGGATETYLEANALGLGSDALTYPGVTQPGAYELLTLVQDSAFILTADGQYLDLKAADVGITRKPATAASGPVQFSLTSPILTTTLIAAGALVVAQVSDPTQPSSVYITQADATIPAGQLLSNIVTATCTATGSQGNQIAGAVNTAINAPVGVTVTNTDSMSGGADTEQDDSLRARALVAVADASQCTVSAIEADALSFATIVYSSLLENTADDGVTPLLGRSQLYVDDGSGSLGDPGNPNHGVIATMQTAYDNGRARAAGTQLHVVGAQVLGTTVAAFVQINAQAAAASSQAAIVAAVQQAVFDYVNSTSIGEPVFISEVIAIAASVPGVSNVVVSSVLINGNPYDLLPSSTQSARCANLAAVTITSAVVAF